MDEVKFNIKYDISNHKYRLHKAILLVKFDIYLLEESYNKYRKIFKQDKIKHNTDEYYELLNILTSINKSLSKKKNKLHELMLEDKEM